MIALADEKKTERYTPPTTTVPSVNDIHHVPPVVELGRSGLRRFGLFVLDDFMQELQSSSRAIQVYREMSDNDSTIGAMLFAIRMFCRAVQWYTTPASQSAEDVEAQEFLESCMEDMEQPWSDVIYEILSFLIYGWSLSETVYKQRLGPEYQDPSKHSKYRDGRIGWRKISLRSQNSLFGWQFAEDGSGDVVAMRQLAPPDFKLIDIPLSKCLLFRTDSSKNNPEGRSILRNAVRAWKFRQNIEVIEGIGIERDLAGLPVVTIPAKVITGQDEDSKAAYETYKALAAGIRRDSEEGVVLPSDVYEGTNIPMYELKLLNSGGARQFNTNEIISRYNTQILATVLADFIILGHENIGSYALAATKTDVFVVALQSYLDIIGDVFNRYAVPRLFALNPEFKLKELPRVAHENAAGVDLQQLGDYLKALKFAGVPIEITDEMLRHLYSAAGLPDPTESAEKIMEEHLENELLLRSNGMAEGGDITDDQADSELGRETQSQVDKAQVWPDEDLTTPTKADDVVRDELNKLPDITAKVLRRYGFFKS